MKVNDVRHITNGYVIPTINYSDQPYLVKADDGSWVCTITTGIGDEGQQGQHIIVTRSFDQGKTWSEPVPLEPPDGPEASYAVLLKVPYGRIYCFYNHNTDNTREIICDKGSGSPDGIMKRVDSQGHFAFKYSDDNGITWSVKRYEVPVRETEIDRKNVYQGKIKFFWNVGKAFYHSNCGYVPLSKVGGFGYGFFTSSEGVLFKSENIGYERDAGKIKWEMLPDGETGLRAPSGGGPISEEQSYTVLSDGSFYCVYRSIDGHPIYTYSRDGGHTWDPPKYKKYANGRLMHHPRAANFAWRCSNGKYLYWFHNNCNKWYEERNPVWVCGGIEIDCPEGKAIQWTQPEILLYDDDNLIRISYPDFMEDDGKYYFTETQKNIARVHEVPNEFLETLWTQFDIRTVCKRGLVMEYNEITSKIEMPGLRPFLVRNSDDPAYGAKDLRSGFTIDFWLDKQFANNYEILLDTRTSFGKGLLIELLANNTVKITMSDGRYVHTWTSDEDMLIEGNVNHVGIIVDGGPKIISFVINGIFNDGNGKRPFGFGRFSNGLHDVSGKENIHSPETANLRENNSPVKRPLVNASNLLKKLRIYDVPLMVTEVIGNYRAGL